MLLPFSLQFANFIQINNSSGIDMQKIGSKRCIELLMLI